MAILRTDIERALDELRSYEEGMRFQGLAVVLGKRRWPELIARQRKKDNGLDAYAPASLTPEKAAKGLAASITPTLKKLSEDAKAAKEAFPDLETLLFVTSGKVGNAYRKEWEAEIQKEHGLTLHVIEREEIITLLMMPENASLGASFLNLPVDAEPELVDIVERTRRAAQVVARSWAQKTKGQPLIELTAKRLDANGAESSEVFSLEQMDQALTQSRRIVLEAPAGRGKTTTLIQIAQFARTSGTALLVELPAWTATRRGILEYVAGMPAFQAEGLTAGDLARVQRTEAVMFLLNGWNEVAESNSAQADQALRELERDFPSAGIIVATRLHHLTPPLPGAVRLRLLPLRRTQRTSYLSTRLGPNATTLGARIDADPSLDGLTRTPFILSGVASLFEAGVEIPSTKIGVFAKVLHLEEQREEHRNALQLGPVFGRQADYLRALATELTRRGAVTLTEVDARTVVASVARTLHESGQIEAVGAPNVLATLVAHHLIERVDYPGIAFQFEHQQFQEHYAALDALARLLNLPSEGDVAVRTFTSEFVNEPAWGEPLRMIAQSLAEDTGDAATDRRNILAGRTLLALALAVDPVFAGELAGLCGLAVWNEVRTLVGERLRAVYGIKRASYRECALAAMLATNSHDFSDVTAPLLSAADQQTRLRTYRLWADIHPSCIGPDWREVVGNWSDEARADFVHELLSQGADDEVADFAGEDTSPEVKKAAAAALIWTRSDEALTRLLDSADAKTFDEIASEYLDYVPAAIRTRAIEAVRRRLDASTSLPARLQMAMDLVEIGVPALEELVRDTMGGLSRSDLRTLDPRLLKTGLALLCNSDPAWTSEWVASRIAEGSLYPPDQWLAHVSATPAGFLETCLQRIETVDLGHTNLEGTAAVIAAHAGPDEAARLFANLCELCRASEEATPDQRREFSSRKRQIEDVFRRLTDDVAAAGILLAVTPGDSIDIEVATDLLNRVAKSDVGPLRIADGAVKAKLREYLRDSMDLVLRSDDFDGTAKARLASSIAQVGNPDDMQALMTLIRADIERVRRGRAARAAGDRGPRGNGGISSYSRWHIAALMHLDAVGAQQLLVDLLEEQEYRSDAAAALAQDYVPRPQRLFDSDIRHDLMWAARRGDAAVRGEDQRRLQSAAALRAQIQREREKTRDGTPAVGLKDLAKALASVDGRGSTAVVLDEIATPGQWGHYECLDAAERLLMTGAIVPATTVFALLRSILERTKSMQDSERGLLRRAIALCPFVDDPVAGIAMVRDVLGRRRLWAHEMRPIVAALGESRSETAVDLLLELANDPKVFEECEDTFVNAIALLDTHRARELLLSFVDPSVGGITLTRPLRRPDVLVARISELVRRTADLAPRLRELCALDLGEPRRHILSKVLQWLGTPEDLIANLDLLDDNSSRPIPQGVFAHLEGAFVERRPYGNDLNTFTEHARASNAIRGRLSRLVLEDDKRRKSAFELLGYIESWRLEHGRPIDEPRHPCLDSGHHWPLDEP